jgi:hypothetical protein
VIIETAPLASSTLPPSQSSASSLVEMELKDIRVRISADAPSVVIAETLKALRSRYRYRRAAGFGLRRAIRTCGAACNA